MASFDKDDFGDLLSEGSDDSFFEEPKVLAKRASLTRTPEKKSVTDIFGLGDEISTVKKSDSDWLGLDLQAKKSEANISKSPIRNRPVKKISFDDDGDDILTNIGLGGKSDTNPSIGKTDESLNTTKLDNNKKTALLESLLDSPKSTNKNKTNFDDILGRKESLMKTTTNLTSQQNTPANFSFGEAPREGRRSRVQQSTLADPLGLFLNETNKPNETQTKTLSKPPENIGKTNKGAGDAGVNDLEVIFPTKPKDMSTKSTPNIPDLPDWLGGAGSPIKTHKSEPTFKKDKTETQLSSNVIIEDDTKETHSEPKETLQKPAEFDFDSLMTQQKLVASEIGYKNASIALQQQESQVLMALQLKKYEENLAEMQKQQQEVLTKQEQQFNALLEKQFAKQQIMEENMRLQQERINNHIQLLISQPPGLGATKNSNSAAEEKVHNLQSAKMEESDRIYEEMIKNLKQHQHEELFLLEESYKKQISILEQTAESTELRLKEEVKHIIEAYENKIKSINSDHEDEIDKYKHYIEDLTNRHKEELRLLRENHDRVIDEIKYEYSTMVENIKHTKQSESGLFENAANYSDRLDKNLQILDVNSRALSELHGKVENDYGILTKAREESLKAKEEEIRLMKETIEKCRESAEMERAQLLTLVRSLEMKIAEQNQSAREDRWALQQATATFTAKSKALDRESEFNRASIEREREQLKTLKENILAEQERIMVQLNEEKLAIAAEKSRLETSSKLTQNYDTQRAKAEIEAAVRVAKEAAEMTDKEREILQQKQCEIESFKRSLVDRERKLSIKERQLHNNMQIAEQRIKEGEKALIEARLLETKYNERLKDIQKQLVSLTNREKKLAEEKIALSKERLALNTQKRQIKKCVLCAVDVDNNERPENNEIELDIVESDYPRLITASDPDLMRIHLEMTENEQNLTERFLEDSFL